MLHRAIQNMTPPLNAMEARMLILKLRWFGLEEEAASLQTLLPQGEIGVLGPLDTD